MTEYVPEPAVNVAAVAEANGELPEQQPDYVAPVEDHTDDEPNVARRAERAGQLPEQQQQYDQGGELPDGSQQVAAGEGVLTVDVQAQQSPQAQ